MTHWANRADQVILSVHNSLPEAATYIERKAALSSAYPFGERRYSPYKTWLRKVKAYLAKYETREIKDKRSTPESPMERMMRRGATP